VLLFRSRKQTRQPHNRNQAMTTTLFRAAGYLAGHSVRLARQIDWQEVGAVALEALKIAIVLTLLAGRATRWAWDSLPSWSEALGRWYSSSLVGEAEPTGEEPAAPALVAPVAPAPAAPARPASPAHAAAAIRVRRRRAAFWATLQQVGA
jgi:hypothetical protein